MVPILFLDEPVRTLFYPKDPGSKILSPFLEQCRALLYRWSKSILKEEYAIYRNGQINFALFNTSGLLEYYYLSGTRYSYEVPCQQAAYTRPVYSKEIFSSQLSLKNCMDFHTYLWQKADEYLHPSYNGYYEGNLGAWCYSNDWFQPFPVPTDVPDEFKDYRIRPDKFYVNTTTRPITRYFKSPSISDYKRLLRRGIIFIDDGTDPSDYLYDYWG